MEIDNDFAAFEPRWEIWAVHHYRGQLAKLEYEFAAAITEFQKARDVVATDQHPVARLCLSETNVAMAHAHISLQQYETALALLDYALVLRAGTTPRCSPYMVEILETMAYCWQQTAQFDRAQLCYDEALELAISLVGEDSEELHRLRYWRMTNELAWKAARKPRQ